MKADFDSEALFYDKHFTHTSIGTAQRKRVYHYLEKYLGHPLKILEINCGTGEDAIWLAKRKNEIIATDASEKMIEMAEAKNTFQNLKFEQIPIQQVSSFFEKERFNLVFSNFGGLNCLETKDMQLFLHHVSGLLTEKAKLILVIMPKDTLWEKVYFLLKGKFSGIFRRKKNPVPVNVSGETVMTHYYNPKEISDISAASFSVKELRPIGFMVPPSYLEPFFKNKKWLLNLLVNLDKLFTASFLSRYADHYIIVLEKK